ncbi:hypothetical protein Q4575_07405 [Psychrosphaera sp. 1_MG-2023]|nr:hypothetical protein [Psychrosphaera sp. 1_MG-2023]MDO6719218.1 hypothetical protein [Psychrosphaera sp. 1_MG-2023]
MTYLRFILLSLCLAICYYALAISTIGIATGNQAWWQQWQDDGAFYHIAQNVIGVAVAAFVPAFLVNSYEKSKKWLSISIIIAFSMVLHGNVNYPPWELEGLIRFFNESVLNGDAVSQGIFAAILLMPLVWLTILKRFEQTEHNIFS